MTYIGAIKRHCDDLLDGVDYDPDSGAHQCGSIAANCAIILDAMKYGTLIDNRPPLANRISEEALELRVMLRECMTDSIDLLGERDWWKDEKANGLSEKYDKTKDRVERTKKLLTGETVIK